MLGSLILASSQAGSFGVPPLASDQHPEGLLMKEQAAYDVRHGELKLQIDPARKHISGTAEIEVEVLEALEWLVFDLDTRLNVSRVRLRTRAPQPVADSAVPGREVPFERRGSKLWVALGLSIPVGARVAAVIDYEGCPRTAEHPPWDGGFTWLRTRDGSPWIATSVQVGGAGLWWPCKEHPSDKPESFALRIRVPAPLVVASNGRLLEVSTQEDGTRTYHWHTQFPIGSYNVALNIAPYDVLTTNYTSVTGEIVPTAYWVLPENKAKGENLLREMLAQMSFYERTLGPYPFRREKYGVAETPYLGMEHQTIIAYGDHYQRGPHGYDWLLHHELGHEWWGNMVAARDWRDFWIHEGLCTYMQALYAEEREGTMAYHHCLYENRRQIRNAWAVVPEKPVSLRQMEQTVGNDAYYKGAWVLHMLRYLIGREATLTVLRRFAYPTAELEKPGATNVCRFVATTDFVRLAEAVSGRKLAWFFKFYLNQPRLPKLVSQVRDDKLLLRWVTPEGFAFPMPLELEANGKLKRIEMPGGQAELSAARYAKAKLDPHTWILKE